MRRPSFLRSRTDPKAALQAHYAQRRKEPIDDGLAVFAAYWNRGYACNPAAIHRALPAGVRGVWVVKRDAADRMPEGIEFVHPATEEYFDLIARAKWFVNNVNWPNNVVKREGQVHVMTHHGTPLKRMGLDLREAAGREKTDDFAQFMRRVARWDYSIAANPFSTRAWASAYAGASFESLETGYPRNDVLANATADDVAAARAALGLEDGQVAVLYAPTHREYDTDGSELLELRVLAGLLPGDHVVLARQHYLEAGGLGDAGRVRDVSSHPSVEELCLAADVLVTDYSSIMFDYAVLDRPIVIHAPDWETYVHKRGTYFDLMAEPPGAVTTNAIEVATLLREGPARPELLAPFRERFVSLEDGHASERVVQAVFRP